MKVVIEYLEGSKDVDVLYFDEYTQQVGEILDVCSREEAGQQYEIVGEINNGRLKLYKKDEIDFKEDDKDEKPKMDEDYEDFLEKEFKEDEEDGNVTEWEII